MSDDTPVLPEMTEDALLRIVSLDQEVITIDGDYHISLSRCATYEDVLGWVIHLNRKNWMHPEIINRFIELGSCPRRWCSLDDHGSFRRVG